MEWGFHFFPKFSPCALYILMISAILSELSQFSYKKKKSQAVSQCVSQLDRTLDTIVSCFSGHTQMLSCL